MDTANTAKKTTKAGLSFRALPVPQIPTLNQVIDNINTIFKLISKLPATPTPFSLTIQPKYTTTLQPV